VRPVNAATGKDPQCGYGVRPVTGTTDQWLPCASGDTKSLPTGSRPVIVVTRCTLGSGLAPGGPAGAPRPDNDAPRAPGRAELRT
jgi:hypothetical protein